MARGLGANRQQLRRSGHWQGQDWFRFAPYWFYSSLGCFQICCDRQRFFMQQASQAVGIHLYSTSTIIPRQPVAWRNQLQTFPFHLLCQAIEFHHSHLASTPQLQSWQQKSKKSPPLLPIHSLSSHYRCLLSIPFAKLAPHTLELDQN